MAISRNKKVTNPNRKPMSVENMSHPISKENQKVLRILDERDKKENY